MSRKKIALVAHDHKKQELLSWVNKHLAIMKQCDIVATGTTGGLIAQHTGLPVTRLKAGRWGVISKSVH